MTHILEATCQKCGETFNPADAQDIIHMLKDNGNFCGGTGDLMGEYYLWTQNPVIWIEPGSLPSFTFELPVRSNVIQLSTGDEGGWCGDITEHSPHEECEGS